MPTPGIAVRRARSPRSMARTRSCGSMPDSTASATFGPMPLTPISRSNRLQLENGRKPVQGQRVLAHVGVDAQRDLGANLAQTVEGRQRHGHVVADTVDVDRRSGSAASRESGREGARSRSGRADSRRQLVAWLVPSAPCRAWTAAARRRSCECTWQMATASASAASCGAARRPDRAAASPSAAPAASRRGRSRPRRA